MVSLKKTVNKLTPTVNSTCRIVISKLTKHDSEPLDTDYLQSEGEISLDLEQVHTSLDRDFVKLLLNTRLGDTGTLATKCADVEFKLAEITRTPSVHEMTDEDKLSRATLHKETGSELFKQGKYEAAFRRFKASVQYLIFMNDKTTAHACELYATVCNNMAMCQIKFNNPAYAIELCGKALSVDDTNVKALYRRASCYVVMKRYEEAMADLVRAHNRESNVSVKKLMETVQAQLKIQDDEYRTVVKNMFR